MGGSSGGRTSQSSTAEIPGELKGLYSNTGNNIQNLQGSTPLSDYTGSNPTKVAGMSTPQWQARSLYNQQLSQPTGRNADALQQNERYSNLLGGTEGSLSDSERMGTTNRYDSLFSDTSGNLEDSSIVQAGGRYFNKSIAPSVTNQATLSGLGRSTANTNALAAAEAETMLPLLQGEQARRERLITGDQGRRDQIMRDEQGRRDSLVTGEQGRTDSLLQGEQARQERLVNQGMAIGDVERGIEQEGYNSEAQDFLRRQGIAENALFGPMGQLPSTFGQTASSKTSGNRMGLK